MENSGHSFTEGYSEGSEPIKLTDAKRIEKEAVAFATEILGEPPFMMDDTIVTGYIAGANSEREHLHDQLKQRDETIKQLKEALKEMIPIAEKYQQWLYLHDGKYQVIIEKARKLTTE